MAARLTPGRRELLARLLRDKGIAARAPVEHRGIPRRAAVGPFPLTFAQEALWIVDQLEPARALHNVPAAVRLVGHLDVPALGRSLNEIVRRHDALRTTFGSRDGRPFQVVAPYAPFVLEPIDVCGSPETEASRIVSEEAHRPFDLEAGPLFRVLLLRSGKAEHVLMLNFHHLITDGWSMGVLTRELDQLYGAFIDGRESPLAELPIQMGDFAVWQRSRTDDETQEVHLAHWRKVIGSGLPVLEIPTDHSRPKVWSFRGRHHPIQLTKALSHALRVLSRRHSVTPFMTLAAAFYAMLRHYSGQDDIVIGSAIAERNQKELEGLIGFLVNMLVLRTDLSGNPEFPELVRRVRETTLGACAHQEIPLTRIVKEVRPERDPGRTPLFQVEFSLLTPDVNPAVYGYGLGPGVGETLGLPGLVVTPVPVDYDNARYDLAVFLWDMPDGIRGTIEYSTDLFEPATVARMGADFERLLRFVVDRPRASLEEFAQHLREAEAGSRAEQEQSFDKSARAKLRSRLGSRQSK